MAGNLENFWELNRALLEPFVAQKNLLLRIWRFFYFYIFIFSFFTKIYFCFRNLQKYIPARPVAGRPGSGRPAAGFCAKNFAKIFARRSLGAGCPAAGRPTPRPPGTGAASPGLHAG